MPRVRSVTLFFGLLAVLAFGLTGCTVAEQKPGEVGNQLQRGMQGQGQIVPNNPTSDSFGAEYR